jgi:hypothetical protein
MAMLKAAVHLPRNIPKASIVAIALLIASYSCSGQMQPDSEFAGYSVGRPIDDYKALVRKPGSYASRTGWQEKTYELPNGNWVYVAPLGRDCLIYWEVNKAGTIVGYKLEGTRCD